MKDYRGFCSYLLGSACCFGQITRSTHCADELEDEIAFTMEVPRALLPWLPELLADLPDLSGATGDVLALLRRFDLPKGAPRHWIWAAGGAELPLRWLKLSTLR